MTTYAVARPLNVLIAAREAALARMLAIILRLSEFHAATVRTEPEAFCALDKDIDAVILVLDPSDPLGEAVLAHIRRSAPIRRPQWVVISPAGEEELRTLYGSLDGHLMLMPFDPWRLVAFLEEKLGASPR